MSAHPILKMFPNTTKNFTGCYTHAIWLQGPRSFSNHPKERNNELAESLSCDMDQFQTATAKYCSKRYTPVWSEKIARSRAKVGILKRALFMCCTKYNTEEQMGNLQHQAGERIQLPRTEQECITLLRKEQKELKELINKDRKLR